MSKFYVSSFLDEKNYFKIARPLYTLIGLKEAIILPELINAYRYLKKNNGLIEIEGTSGWFYLTMEKIFQRTSLTARQQRPIINNLIELGILKSKTHGLPSKRYFCIDTKILAEFLSLTNIGTQQDYLMDLFEDDYCLVNSALSHYLGLNESIILSEIVNKSDYFNKCNQSITIDNKPGWFYLKCETIQERTSLNKKQQIPAIRNLVALGLIKTKNHGLFAKRYIRLDKRAIEKFFLKKKKEYALSSSDDLNNSYNDNIFTHESKKDKTSTKTFSETSDKNPKKPYIGYSFTPHSGYNFAPSIYKNISTKIRKDNVPRFSRSEAKTLDPKTKYKLSEAQANVVDWLQSHEVNTNEATMCFWSKTYDFLRICEVYRQAKFEKSRNIGGRMNQLLRDNTPVLHANVEECRAFAMEFKEATNWDDLEIKDRYVTYMHRGREQELPLTLVPTHFAEILIQKRKNIRGEY